MRLRPLISGFGSGLFRGAKQSTQGRVGWLPWLFSWKTLAVVLLAVLMAKWMWVFLMPVSPAVPVTGSWKKTNDAGRLFGESTHSSVSGVVSTASMGGVKLIGVFAHKTRGFAVLQVDNKQIGVALGGMVMPGVKLLETQADHVVLEHDGRQQRVDLAEMEQKVATNETPTLLAVSSVNSASAVSESTEIQAALKVMEKLPPNQRGRVQREIDKMRNRH